MRNFGSMMDSVLARHGIGKQVMAAQVVRAGNEKLLTMISPELSADIHVLSFKDGVLTIACRHPVARYEAESLAPTLARALEESFPSLSLTCTALLRPDAFQEV